ncbi:hypothetical protein Kpol_1072p3 [Vanderwaltozyma polyspora DSM 70294]|uniref:Uncharacterized protein n=1 Tax=Vanderwaltozyma polyspora (strain ATCC 22028 / DSM 70294 / BCRC 21397 / CBS 2163 / NBRC 10782 / NRRL Y-8283 / UCD 57-17) TaxID=436907 RepID=A7TKM1_VANPO|nr:uncharacterized protein Kpol_1072p3 [Vanderwaltozyma polyspora DSM 70294]EDO17133.1 hypothetical protein Kpol_1072p3 [Vanderwaltozyma polyspora DSM 70294]
MRAPPPLRNSKSKALSIAIIKVRQLYSCTRLKRRWHVYKLHKLKKGIADNNLINSGQDISPVSSPHAENMINIPSGLDSKANFKKPLLIASFPEGCSNSPKMHVLRRNSLSRLLLSRRRYKLKHYYNETMVKGTTGDEPIRMVQNNCNHLNEFQCASNVASIRKIASEDADIKVVFHGRNIIKQLNIPIKEKRTEKSPEFLEFGPSLSLRIKDFPSLLKKEVKDSPVQQDPEVPVTNFVQFIKEPELCQLNCIPEPPEKKSPIEKIIHNSLVEIDNVINEVKSKIFEVEHYIIEESCQEPEIITDFNNKKRIKTGRGFFRKPKGFKSRKRPDNVLISYSKLK